MKQEDILERLNRSRQRYEARINKLTDAHGKIGYWRLGLFISGVVTFFLSFFFLPDIFLYVTIVVFAILFGVISSIMAKYERGIWKSKKWLNIIIENRGRLLIDWKEIPEKEYPRRPNHPFETDINITGEYSLLRLIDTTGTKESMELLKGWLTNPPDPIEVISERQQLVKELIPLDHFRNRLRIAGGISGSKGVSGKQLINRLKAGAFKEQIKRVLLILSLLIPVNIVLIVLNIFGVLPAYWSFTTISIIGIYFFNRHYIGSLFEETMKVEEEIGRFSEILNYLEKYKFAGNTKLAGFTKGLNSGDRRPSIYFKKLSRLITAISFQRNPLTFLLFNALFPYDFYIAYLFSNLKESVAGKLEQWLEVWYKLEALTALANFGYLNDSYTFPSIIESSEGAVFNAVEIGHPLLAPAARVNNNFSISGLGKGVIITGSNMSGKSTFLKTVGLNSALAYAGSVVAANELSLIRFRLFTCINIIDSVTDGISYFYAEVKRLKRLKEEVEKPGEAPVFYLIDEIFRGTNNRERLIGSRSYLKSLAGRNCSGLISTHDLELVNLEEEINEIENYHFREEVEEGKLSFDYKIKRGPCPTTNALKIMELEGLHLEIPPAETFLA